MTNTFIIVEDIYQEKIRINIDNIIQYKAHGESTLVELTNGSVYLNFLPEKLDSVLSEAYFMVKNVSSI